jgi:hypothetical protein
LIFSNLNNNNLQKPSKDPTPGLWHINASGAIPGKIGKPGIRIPACNRLGGKSIRFRRKAVPFLGLGVETRPAAGRTQLARQNGIELSHKQKSIIRSSHSPMQLAQTFSRFPENEMARGSIDMLRR